MTHITEDYKIWWETKRTPVEKRHCLELSCAVYRHFDYTCMIGSQGSPRPPNNQLLKAIVAKENQLSFKTNFDIPDITIEPDDVQLANDLMEEVKKLMFDAMRVYADKESFEGGSAEHTRMQYSKRVWDVMSKDIILFSELDTIAHVPEYLRHREAHLAFIQRIKSCRGGYIALVDDQLQRVNAEVIRTHNRAGHDSFMIFVIIDGFLCSFNNEIRLPMGEIFLEKATVMRHERSIDARASITRLKDVIVKE